MQKVNLYRYENEDGSITVTPVQREASDPVYKMRLIAEDGKILTDGASETPCTDCTLEDVDKWYEKDEPSPAPEEEATADDYEAALERLGVE